MPTNFRADGPAIVEDFGNNQIFFSAEGLNAFTSGKL